MEQLTNYLKSIIAPKSTAVSYAIMQHGTIVASDAIGVINQKENKPVTTNCTFNVASISKIYVTVAIMQLVEQGKITLDTKVCDILDQFTMKDERYKDITIHMLLDHTCALPGTQWKHFSLTQLDGVDYYDEVYHYLSTYHLKANPGEIAVYCNDGFTVAELVVSKVSGQRYEEYVKEHITEPIGAHSTRLSYSLNPDYPLVSEGKKAPELLAIMGAAGVTTSMEDLCKFGQLFLTENSVISEKSKQLMAQNWGKTFLTKDLESTKYGLGWDDVVAKYDIFDLGEHVVTKGGNSFQFFSRLFVIPKYDAVLAISATHDTKINPEMEILRLFDYYMQLNGKSVSNYQPFDNYKEYEGIYYDNFSMTKIKFYGSMLVEYTLDDEEKWIRKDNYFHKDGSWSNDKNEAVLFERFNNSVYLLNKAPNNQYPVSQKLDSFKPFDAVWKNRIGEKYIVCDATPYDIVISEMFAGVTLQSQEDGILLTTFNYRKNSDNWLMRSPCLPISETRAEGFVDTPFNGSRDMTDPEFVNVDGKEMFEMASYHYVNTKDIKEYSGQGFSNTKWNNVFHFTYLQRLPDITSGHRVIILKENLDYYYDSLDGEDYKTLDKGYIILI